jgi:tetratricopeptide (TPR) repeat protein
MLVHADLRTLHAAAARAIESFGESEERSAAALAFHYDRADMPDAAAIQYLAAGRAAAKRFSNEEALEHLDRAYELSGGWDPRRRFDIVELRYTVHDVLGARDAQRADLDRMEELDVDAPDIASRMALLKGGLLASLGSYAEADAIVAGTLRRLDTALGPHDRAAMIFMLAQIARYQGNADDARDKAATARSLYEGAGDSVRVATVDDFLGGVAWDQGDFDAAAVLHRAAAETFANHNRSTDEIGALNNLGSALFAIGDYSEARRIHEAGAIRSHEIGFRMGEGDNLDNTGGTAWAVGDYDLATERYTQALVIRERMNDAWGVAISKGNLGATRRAQGFPADALGLYREAFEIDTAIGRRRGEAYDLHGMGLCYVDLGRLNLASESLAEAASIRDELGETHLANESRSACAVAMYRRGDEADAVDLIESVLGSEGANPFDGAVETTASLLRSIEVLASSKPEQAEDLRLYTAKRVASRSDRISDPAHRSTYLQSVASHRAALGT